MMRRFILDTDWWTDCDDAVAIRLLCNAHLDKEVEVLGININACMPFSIPSLDVFTRDCGVDVPLAVAHKATDFAGNPPYQEHLAKCRTPRRNNEDVPESIDFYRQLLAGAEDDSVEILSIGFTQVLADLVSQPGGRELVAAKVKHLWIMAGKWDEDGGREYNFCNTPLASRSGDILCREWCSPITFLGFEIGNTVITGTKLSPDDLLKKAMIAHGSGNGRASWDPMLILLALCGSPEAAGYRAVRGWASVSPETGRNHFKEDPQGPHCYVVKCHPDSFYADWIDENLPLDHKIRLS